MANSNDTQQVSKAKGRPMLSWVGKKPLEKVEYFPAQEKEIKSYAISGTPAFTTKNILLEAKQTHFYHKNF